MKIPIFRNMNPDEIIQVHDYEIFRDLPTLSFDYVSAELVGSFVDKAGAPSRRFARPVLTVLEIFDIFQHKKCVCGNVKRNMQSHCTGCYKSLSPEKQKALWNRFRQGYEQAFLVSLITLIDDGRTDLEKIRAAVPVGKDRSAARRATEGEN